MASRASLIDEYSIDGKRKLIADPAKSIGLVDEFDKVDGEYTLRPLNSSRLSSPRDSLDASGYQIPRLTSLRDSSVTLQREPDRMQDPVVELPKGKLGFMDKIREIGDNPSQLVPFLSGVAEAKALYEVYDASRRVKEGTASVDDMNIVGEFLDKSNQDTDFWYKVMDVVAALPAFAGELYTTGGLYSIGKKATAIGLKKLIGEGIKEGIEAGTKKGLVRTIGEKSIASLGGSVVQFPVASAARVYAEQIERRIPDIQRDDKGGIVVGDEKDAWDALVKASGNQFIEIASERSGGLLTTLTDPLKDKIAKYALVKAIQKLNPAKTSKQVQDFIGKVGYHGIAGEMFEERVGEAMRAGLQLEDYKLPSAEQLLVELVSFSVPSGLAHIASEFARPGEARREVARMAPEAERELAEAQGKTGDQIRAKVQESGAKPPQSYEEVWQNLLEKRDATIDMQPDERAKQAENMKWFQARLEYEGWWKRNAPDLARQASRLTAIAEEAIANSDLLGYTEDELADWRAEQWDKEVWKNAPAEVKQKWWEEHLPEVDAIYRADREQPYKGLFPEEQIKDGTKYSGNNADYDGWVVRTDNIQIPLNRGVDPTFGPYVELESPDGSRHVKMPMAEYNKGFNNNVFVVIRQERPTAKFAGWQEDGQGGAFPLFHIEGGKRDKSTVSLKSLAEEGIDVPDHPTMEEWQKSQEKPTPKDAPNLIKGTKIGYKDGTSTTILGIHGDNVTLRFYGSDGKMIGEETLPIAELEMSLSGEETITPPVASTQPKEVILDGRKEVQGKEEVTPPASEPGGTHPPKSPSTEPKVPPGQTTNPAPKPSFLDNLSPEKQKKLKDLQDRLRRKLDGTVGIIDEGDDIFTLGLQMTPLYIEAGLVEFKAFAKQLHSDFGEAVKPYIESFYNSLRGRPGIDRNSLTSVDEVAKLASNYDETLKDAEEITPEEPSETESDDEEIPPPTGDPIIEIPFDVEKEIKDIMQEVDRLLGKDKSDKAPKPPRDPKDKKDSTPPKTPPKIEDLIKDINGIFKGYSQQANMPGLDIQLWTKMIQVGAHFINQGAVKFKDWVKTIYKAAGEEFFNNVRAHLRSMYITIRDNIGMGVDGKTVAKMDADDILLATNIDDLIQETKQNPVPENWPEGKPILQTATPDLLPTIAEDPEIDKYGQALDDVQNYDVRAALQHLLKPRMAQSNAFLLGNGTGLGKTREILVVAWEHQKRTGKPTLIVKPTSDEVDNYKRDAKALGIPYHMIESGTYNDIKPRKNGGPAKIGLGKYGLVIFDECHNLKNWESGKSQAAIDIKTEKIMFSSATPLDKDQGAAYFISEVTGESEEHIEHMLGLVWTQQINPYDQTIKWKPEIDPNVGYDQFRRNLITMRDKMVSDGAAMFREYPPWGDIDIQMYDVLQDGNVADEYERLNSYWEGRMERAKIPEYKKKIGGAWTMDVSRWLETFKVKYTLGQALRAYMEGKHVVIFVEGLNEQTIGGFPLNPDGTKYKRKGAGAIIDELLREAGVRYSKIYDPSKNDIQTEVEKFQSGETRFAVATIKTGGTGIDLDDQVGNAPREVFIMSSDWAGDGNLQLLGRFSRRNSKSPTNVHYILAPNTRSDDARRRYLIEKIGMIQAMKQGRSDIGIGTPIGGLVGAGHQRRTGNPTVIPSFTITTFKKPWGEDWFAVSGSTYAIRDELSKKDDSGKKLYKAWWGAIRGINDGKPVWSFPMVHLNEIQAILDAYTEEVRQRLERESEARGSESPVNEGAGGEGNGGGQRSGGNLDEAGETPPATPGGTRRSGTPALSDLMLAGLTEAERDEFHRILANVNRMIGSKVLMAGVIHPNTVPIVGHLARAGFLLIKSGYRQFGPWARKMVKFGGLRIKPFLVSAYNAAFMNDEITEAERNERTPADEVKGYTDADLDRILADETDQGSPPDEEPGEDKPFEMPEDQVTIVDLINAKAGDVINGIHVVEASSPRNIGIGASGRKYKFVDALVELGSLIASNNWQNFSINPAFPAELQGKDRAGRAGNRDQVELIAKGDKTRRGIDYDTLSHNRAIDQGAPAILRNMVVVGGNGRVMAMNVARESWPHNWTEYQKNLREEYGSEAKGMTNPVLVRILAEAKDYESLVAFADDTNTPATAALSPAEQALTDARYIGREFWSKLVEVGDTLIEMLTARINMSAINDLFASMPSSSLTGMKGDDGSLNKPGAERIRNAGFIGYFGKDGYSIAGSFFEDDENKRISNGISLALPKLIKSVADAETFGIKSVLGVPKIVLAAVQQAVKYQSGNVRDVDQFFGQRDLLGSIDPLVESLARLIIKKAGDGGSVQKVSNIFLKIASASQSQIVDPNQAGLFGDAPSLTANQIVERAIRETDEGVAPVDDTEDLFGGATVVMTATAEDGSEVKHFDIEDIHPYIRERNRLELELNSAASDNWTPERLQQQLADIERLNQLVHRLSVDSEDEDVVEMQDNTDSIRPPGSRMLLEEQRSTTKSVNLPQIINYINKNFDLLYKVGRMRAKKGVLAYYKIRPEIVRTRNYDDLLSFAHELGHHIDKKFGLSNTMPGGVRHAKLPQGARDELKLLDYDQSLQRPFEGFAEYIRAWLANEPVPGVAFSDRIQAQTEAPQFHAIFTTWLDTQPEMKIHMETVSDMLQTWVKMGALDRIAAQIDSEGKIQQGTPWQRLQKGWIDFKTFFVHEYSMPIEMEGKTLGESSAKAVAEGRLDPKDSLAEMITYYSRTAASRAKEWIMTGTFDAGGNLTGISLKEAISKVADDMGSFCVYMVSRRALELHRRGIKSGLDPKGAAFAVRTLGTPEFREAFKAVKGYQDRVFQYLVDCGTLTNEQAFKIRSLNNEYIPFARAFGFNELLSGNAVGKGIVDIGNCVYRIKGSGRPIRNPLESIINNTVHIMQTGDKALIAKSLINWADTNPSEAARGGIVRVAPKLQPNHVTIGQIARGLADEGIDLDGADLDAVLTWFTNAKHYGLKENVVNIWRNGKQEFWEVDPDLYKVLKGLNDPQMPPFINAIADFMLGRPARLVRMGATAYRASFGLVMNPIRDMFTLMLQSKYLPMYEAPFRALEGIYRIARNADDDLMVQRFNRSGVEMSTMLGQNPGQMQKAIDDVMGNPSKMKNLNVVDNPLEAIAILMHTVRQKGRVGIEFYKSMMSVAESGVRFAEYQAAYKRLSAMYGEGSVSAQIGAANAASEVTIDFRRMGVYSRVINQTVPFFAATIQGPIKMARVIRDDPVKAGLRAFTALTVPTLLLWWMHKDDDWYKEMPAWQKYGFWLIPIGGTKDRPTTILRIPRPFTWSLAFSAGPEMAANYLYDKDKEGMLAGLGYFNQSLTPDLMPAAIKPIIEWWANKDMFRDRAIVPYWEEKTKDPEDQWGPYTTETSKEIGSWFGLSPRKLDHVISVSTGGLGMDLIRASEGLSRIPERGVQKFKRTSDVPIVGRLIAEQEKQIRTPEEVKNVARLIKSKISQYELELDKVDLKVAERGADGTYSTKERDRWESNARKIKDLYLEAHDLAQRAKAVTPGYANPVRDSDGDIVKPAPMALDFKDIFTGADGEIAKNLLSGKPDWITNLGGTGIVDKVLKHQSAVKIANRRKKNQKAK